MGISNEINGLRRDLSSFKKLDISELISEVGTAVADFGGWPKVIWS